MGGPPGKEVQVCRQMPPTRTTLTLPSPLLPTSENPFLPLPLVLLLHFIPLQYYP